MENTSDVCCPRFIPENWDGKTLIWENKRFIKARVRTFLYMPLNFGTVMSRLQASAEKAGAMLPDQLTLSDQRSRWHMDLYLETMHEIPGADNVFLSGQYLCKVYEGAFRDAGNWTKDFVNYVSSTHRKLKTILFWYTTCPKCAKKYGKNYVVLLGELD